MSEDDRRVFHASQVGLRCANSCVVRFCVSGDQARVTRKVIMGGVSGFRAPFYLYLVHPQPFVCGPSGTGNSGEGQEEW